MNYERNQQSDSIVHTYELAPFGDVRKEIEKAAQRAFHNETSDVRACLLAADVTDVNPSHPHASSYKRRAEDMNVSRETFESGGLTYVRVTIEVAQ